MNEKPKSKFGRKILIVAILLIATLTYRHARARNSFKTFFVKCQKLQMEIIVGNISLEIGYLRMINAIDGWAARREPTHEIFEDLLFFRRWNLNATLRREHCHQLVNSLTS